jgi:hypothetical protein
MEGDKKLSLPAGQPAAGWMLKQGKTCPKWGKRGKTGETPEKADTRTYYADVDKSTVTLKSMRFAAAEPRIRGSGLQPDV